MRHFRLMLLVIVLAALVLACGGGDETSTATSESRAAATATTTPAEPTATLGAASPTATFAHEEGNCEILFAADLASDQTGHRIYCIDADGTGLYPLTNAAGEMFTGEIHEGNPAWSPDGTRIAFTRTGTEGGVFVVNADGTGERRILDGWAWPPSWSPDGERLALSWLEDGWPPAQEKPLQIVAVDADGSNLRVLNAAPELRDGPVTDLFPKWSPDGTRILFQHWAHAEQAEEDVIGLWIVNVDGSGLQQVETGEVVAFDGTWAPEGDALLVAGGIPDDPHPPGIFRISLVGGAPERLTPPGVPLLIGSFDVSPDGSRITYTSTAQEITEDFDPEEVDWDLFAIEIASGEARAITETPDIQEFSPSWSPDGDRLLYVAFPPDEGLGDDVPENAQLTVINADGTHQVALVDGLSMVTHTSTQAWRRSTGRQGNVPVGRMTITDPPGDVTDVRCEPVADAHTFVDIVRAELAVDGRKLTLTIDTAGEIPDALAEDEEMWWALELNPTSVQALSLYRITIMLIGSEWEIWLYDFIDPAERIVPELSVSDNRLTVGIRLEDLPRLGQQFRWWTAAIWGGLMQLSLDSCGDRAPDGDPITFPET